MFTGEELRKKAAEQWYRDLPLKAKRGAVYDCEGQAIVDSKDVFTVYVRPAAVKDKSLVAKVLAEQLEVNEEKLFEKISKATVSEITVKKNVDFSTGGKLRDMTLDGVYFSVDSARNYPYDGCLTQVIERRQRRTERTRRLLRQISSRSERFFRDRNGQQGHGTRRKRN